MTDPQTVIAPSGAPAKSRADRFAAYQAKLEALKDMGARREIVERELLVELASVNLDRLAGFPLLDKERQGLLDILLKRSQEHALKDQIKAWIDGFILAVNRFAVARAGQDEQALPQLELEAAAAEAVLLKCLQALTFQAGLAKDNLSDAIIRRHGEEAVRRIDAIAETAAFGEAYFKALIDVFSRDVAVKAYDDIIGGKRAKISRDGQFLTVSFPFEAVLARLAGTDKAIGATRVQSGYAATAAGPEAGKVVDILALWLHGGEHKALAFARNRDDLPHLARILAMDPVAGSLINILAGEIIAGGAPQDDTVSKVEFVKDQAAAAACGAALALDSLKEDFARALRQFESREIAAITAPIATFATAQLEAAVELLFEGQFLHILKEKGEPESGKFVIRIVRQRCLTPDRLAVLAKAGLNRIRQRQILDPLPEAPESLVFKARNLAELDAQIAPLHFEDALIALLKRAFEASPAKVDFALVLNLAKIAKVTTNLPAKVGEILALFGVRP